ncbi:hypothetical protein L218DRAFT_994026 [Marasmius fiardii PR-910]|nr:hypothetical protein L218DRAFT_994026 [Marasmius fiardii PR-910]
MSQLFTTFREIENVNNTHSWKVFGGCLAYETKKAFKEIWTVRTLGHGNLRVNGTPMATIVERAQLLTGLVVVLYQKCILQDTYLKDCMQFLFDTAPNNLLFEAMGTLIEGVEHKHRNDNIPEWLPKFNAKLNRKYGPGLLGLMRFLARRRASAQ